MEASEIKDIIDSLVEGIYSEKNADLFSKFCLKVKSDLEHEFTTTEIVEILKAFIGNKPKVGD